MVKDFTQKNDIDYEETFSLTLKKDVLRIVLNLVFNYNLKLHQENINTLLWTVT